MNKTIPELFFEVAKNFSQDSALSYKHNGIYTPISYYQLSLRVQKMASILKAYGLNKGDAVALLSENRPEWLIADLAIMSLGAITVPLHTTLVPRAMSEILRHCEAKICIVSNHTFSTKLLDFKGQVLDWNALAQESNTEFFDNTIIMADPDDICTIMYTSGTTGEPKGVALTHKNILSNVVAVNAVVPVKPGDVFLSFLPLSHILERTVGHYIPLFFGATIAYAESAKQLAHNLQEVKPTVLIAVPRVFEKFHDSIWDGVKTSWFKKKLFIWALRQVKNTVWYSLANVLVFQKIRNVFGGKLRLAICGGAALHENLPKFFSNIGITILEGYGLTETSPVISTNTQSFLKFRTVGQPLQSVMVKVNADKEILVKGDSVFKGYYRDAIATQKAFDADGWFLTGDLGFIDVQGFLTIIGRKKDMFVLSGGKNIWPENIENVLNNDKFITQSIVVGRNQKFVSALIFPDWPEVERAGLARAPKSKELLALFQKRFEEKINPTLSKVEQIKKFTLLGTSFSQEKEELTPTLKLRRHVIERRYEEEINNMYYNY